MSDQTNPYLTEDLKNRIEELVRQNQVQMIAEEIATLHLCMHEMKTELINHKIIERLASE